jgi:hypothetical protein
MDAGPVGFAPKQVRKVDSNFLVEIGALAGPRHSIGLIIIMRRAKAFGLTVIIVGLGLAVVGTGFVVGLFGCF